jgi:hypothetical protein
MKRSCWLLCAVSMATAACGSGPTGPSSRPGDPASGGSQVLTFLSGETHQAVAGATVVVQGRSYITTLNGSVRLDQPLGDSTVIDATAPSFLERRTLLRGDLYTLWPKESPVGLDETYTARLVYNCAAAPCPAGEPLLRVTAGPVWIVPSTELQGDPEAMRSHEAAAALLTQATGGAVTFGTARTAPSAGVVVRTYVDPNDPDVLAWQAAAVTRRRLGDRWNVVGADIVLRSVELARLVPLMLHEMGHVFGLGHSPRVGDVMFFGRELYQTTDFSPPERLTIGLMLQRSPGNRFPDEDSGLAAASSKRQVSVVVCGGHQ